MNVKQQKNRLLVYLMTVPSTVIYTFFLVAPIILAFYFSFQKWNGINGSPLEFIGLQNYQAILGNRQFLKSMTNLAQMVVFSILLRTPLALLLAVALNHKFRGSRFFRVAFFVPTILPLTAIGLLWYFIFMPNGAFNSGLELFGLGQWAQGWLINSATAIPTIIFVHVWSGLGYYMVIFLAALKDIPMEINDAALIDGATAIKKFFYVTVPMLKPIIALCILLNIISTVKVFDLVFVMTEGGPNGLTNVPTMLMYNEAFKYNNYGIGSAIGVIIFGLILVLTLGSDYLLGRRKG